jgi:hypothetical protein
VIKIWTRDIMKGSGKGSRGDFLIKRGVEIDFRGVREVVEGSERRFRPSKMNNRSAGDLNRGVRRSIEGSSDHSRGRLAFSVAPNTPRSNGRTGARRPAPVRGTEAAWCPLRGGTLGKTCAPVRSRTRARLRAEEAWAIARVVAREGLAGCEGTGRASSP